MKRSLLIIVIVSMGLLYADEEAFAQRGSRGGGGGARPSVNRSPSMSRPAASSRPASSSRPTASRPSTPNRPSAGQLPTTRPSTGAATRPSAPSGGTRPSTGSGQRPTTGQRPATGQRPSSGQLNDFLNLPKQDVGTRPGSSRPPTASQLPSTDRGKIQNAIGAGASTRPATPDWFKPGTSPPTAGQLPAKPGAGDRPVATPPIAGQPNKPPANRPPGTIKPPGSGDRPVATPPIAGKPGRPPGTRPPGVRPPARPPVAVRPPAGRPPRPWYPGHPHHPDYRPGHWWHWATAGAITGWVVHRWTTPIYYRYGSGGTVYYENNVVYVNGEQYGSAEQYYNDTAELATSVPEMTDEQAGQMEWMPLGVFALTAEGVNASSMYLQLAISKEGVIAGTFYNESTGATHPVEGMIDEATQRAVWMAADGTNKDVVMETGIYNLTQDQAEVLVHFGPEQTQNVLLVRLDESERPESDDSGQS